MRKLNKISRAAVLGLAGAALASALIACGTSSSNDQGTSFLATGFFQNPGTGTSGQTNQQGDSGVTVPLSTDSSVLNFDLPSQVEVRPDGLWVTSYLGLQNRLATRFVNVARIDCEYTIPGASISIPPDSYAVGGVLGPDPSLAPTVPGVTNPGTGTGTGTGSGTGSSGSGSTTGGTSSIASQRLFEVTVASPELFGYLNNNRSALPALPFRMIATCTAVGRTQGNDELRTNPVNYSLQFVDIAECCTVARFQPIQDSQKDLEVVARSIQARIRQPIQRPTQLLRRESGRIGLY